MPSNMKLSLIMHSVPQTSLSASADAQIEQAILSTVAYRDCFDFPVTLAEIHRFLHGVRCDRQDVARVLSATALCHGRLETDGTYYCLAGRDTIIAGRYPREDRAQLRLKSARKVARILATIPHIRMVALSGALAARNSTEGDDLDFFCVTEQGKLWRTRALVLCVKLVDAKTTRNKICPNYFLSTAAMTLDTQRMYIAHEMAQMVPMYGLETYAEMRAQNDWVDTVLPNATRHPDMTDGLSVSAAAPLKTALEWAMKTPPGAWFERMESDRKIRRFNADDFYDTPHTQFTKERTGQRKFIGEWIETEWQARLAEFRDPNTPPSAMPFEGHTSR